MSMLWTNNASSVLTADITAGTLSITVTAGHGDRFPAVAAPHYFNATLVDTLGNREIVKVTARTSGSNTMTITRAQESTSARSFATGDIVELRITKNAMDKFSKSADIHENHYVCDASAADQGATTNSASLKSIVDSLGATEEATIELPHTGTGDTTTYTVGTNLTIPATVTLRVHKGARVTPSTGVTLTVNGIVQAGAYTIFAGAGTVTVSTYPQDQAWGGSTRTPASTALAAVTPAADKLPYFTSASAAAVCDISAFARTVLDDANAAAARATLGTFSMPSGVIMPYGGASAPSGWLLCYGQTVSQTTYADLYAIIGHSFGADPGGGDFILPDLRGRFPLGKDNMGGSSANRVTDTDADTLGGADGDETKDLSHTHGAGTLVTPSLSLASHTVSMVSIGIKCIVDGDGDIYAPYAGGPTISCTVPKTSVSSGVSITGSTASGASATQDIMPPFITLNYIIKT